VKHGGSFPYQSRVNRACNVTVTNIGGQKNIRVGFPGSGYKFLAELGVPVLYTLPTNPMYA